MAKIIGTDKYPNIDSVLAQCHKYNCDVLKIIVDYHWAIAGPTCCLEVTVENHKPRFFIRTDAGSGYRELDGPITRTELLEFES